MGKCPFGFSSAAGDANTAEGMKDTTTPKCPYLAENRDKGAHAPAAERRTNSSEKPASCPYGAGESTPQRKEGQCPYGFGRTTDATDLSHGLSTLNMDGHSLVEEQARIEGRSSEPKCPMGYDSDTVKVGPLTCLVCKSLLFNSVRILPCRHLFCNSCCVRLDACGLCGGEKQSLEQDDETRMLDQNVSYFIDKYARLKKRDVSGSPQQVSSPSVTNAGEGSAQDLALEQGGLLLQLAMRAYNGRNEESAVHLLKLCEEDLRNALAEEGPQSKVLCQLGAIAGARGDVSRSAQDFPSAAKAYRESATWLELVQDKNAEVVHDLSVAYNKLGDLHFLAKRPDEAREEYLRALELRQGAHTADSTASQVLDLVVSFTKVADLDRASKKERAAVAHFREAAKVAAELGQKREEYSGALEQKRLALLEFIAAQCNGLEDGSQVAVS